MDSRFSCLFVVKLVLPDADGRGGAFEIRTLEPLDWIDAWGAEPGSAVYIDFDEIGIKGWATVVSVHACPPIEDSPGRVVLSTFTRITTGLLQLRIEGLDDPIDVTANHPLFSHDRQTWVPAGDLTISEQLWTAGGPASIVSAVPLAGTHRVYNLEVEHDHRYYVSVARVLAHNAKCGPAGAATGSAKTPVSSGTSRAPKTGTPNSIYEQVDDAGNLKSRTFYDENGAILSADKTSATSTEACDRTNTRWSSMPKADR